MTIVQQAKKRKIQRAVESSVAGMLDGAVSGIFGRGVPAAEPEGDEIFDGEPDLDVLKQILEDLYQSHVSKKLTLPKPAFKFLGELRDGETPLTEGALDRGLQLVETYRPSSLRSIYQGAGESAVTVSQHIVDVASGRVKAGTLNERVPVKSKAKEKPLTPGPSPRSTGARGETGGGTWVIGDGVSNGKVVELAIATLHTLPENPEPGEAKVKEIAESIKTRGLDEPLIVRPASCCDGYELPDGAYQVLSGATRLAACRRLNLILVPCRVRTDIFDKANALAFAAGTNNDRREISDFERAHWLQQLHDAGWTDAQAAEVYHISREQASNLRRLLKVPPVWRQRVEDGDLMVTVVRDGILPYAHAPKVLEQFEFCFYDILDFEDNAKGQIDAFRTFAERITRPLGGKAKVHWQAGEQWPCLVSDADPDVFPAMIPVFDKKACKYVDQLRATDAEAWDLKQVEAVEAKLAERRKREAKKADKADRGPSPPASLPGVPGRGEKVGDRGSKAAGAAESRRDADQAKAELAARIDNWSRVALLWATADSLKRVSEDTLQMAFPVLVFRVIALVCKMGHARYVSRAFHHASTGRWPANAFDQGDPWREIQAAVNRRDGGSNADDGIAGLRIARDAACVLLFTPERVENKQALLINWSDGEVAAAAVDQGVSLADVWSDAQVIDSPAYHLVAEFFGLHNFDQLQQLAEQQLDSGNLVEECRKKKELLAALLVAHNGEGLPLPKALR